MALRRGTDKRTDGAGFQINVVRRKVVSRKCFVYSPVLASRLSSLGDFILWGGSKGVINFPWIFMQCRVTSLLGTSGTYPGTHSLGLFAGLFTDAMG